MFQKIPGLAVVVVVFLILGVGMGGCVAKSDYLLKQAEANALNRDLAAVTTQNSDFKAQIEKMTAATEGLIADKDRLIVDTERLEKERTDLDARLNRITEESNRTIEELRNRNTELEGDKQMFAESISLLEKTKEVEVRTVSKTYEDLLSEMKSEIAQGQIAITELKGKLTVDVVDKILFDSGQTEIRPEGLGVLKRVVEILMTVTDKMIRVEGHTDSIPTAGALAKRYPTNWELSAARALNVTRYLEKQGIDPSLLAAVAFGEYQPIAENDTPEGRAKNRRIAIILLPKE
ncbi:MAG: OmpA family protein [Deltaproteobacteria bacterium]|nr:OmpA family protein [Deltaproteobacteria bacterium]